MASRIALLCLLGLLVASSARPDSGIYYQIAFMWPGAYCEQTNAGCCMPTTGVVPARDFYISGFTVYNATTNAPKTRCSKTPFNLTEIIEIEGLKQYWSNIKCPSNNGQNSWKTAWKKTGACSGLEEKAYFEAALALRNRINPLARLVSKGIKPDFSLYSVKRIKKVIQAGIGATPVIQCSKGPFDKFQLYQIYICVADDGETFIDCPAAPKYTCSDEILFHPFEKWMLKEPKEGEPDETFELPSVAMDH
ncbi:ribonuclease 1-like [Phragmites australis]|uniref:ribonuclease 1-like n=1 Tax=Phragmites australis TaxID=29695 RepID=UPI002D7A2C12|nr:ribonuclease 1-like [Phragmites australis]